MTPSLLEPTFPTAGRYVGAWMRDNVRQTIGRFKGTPLDPMAEVWQQEFLDELFRLTGPADDPASRRVYQDGLLNTPKKNGKSTFGAGLGLYMVSGDHEPSAEVYVAASSQKQATVIHAQAKAMVDESPGLQALGLNAFQYHIEAPSNSVFRVLAADAARVHGVNPHCSLIDEKWAHKSQDLVVALAGGTGAREEPLTLTMTTLGHDLASPFGEDYVAAFNYPDIEVRNDGYLYVCRDLEAGALAWIYAPPFDIDALRNGNGFQPLVDLDDPAVWARCNPASWITEQYLRRRFVKTKREDFYRFHLNAWTESAEFWLPGGSWAACRLHGSNPDESIIPRGSRVWLAIDMGGKRDCAAVVAVALVEHPDADAIEEETGERPEPYLYVDAVIIDSPPGDEKVNPAAVRNVVRDACSLYDVVEVAYDPWRMEESAGILADDPALDGVDIVEFPQSNVRMAPASQRIYDAIVNGRLRHNGNVQLNSHVAAGVWTETDQGGRLTRRNTVRFVDGLIAMTMAVDRADRSRGERSESVYEERDLFVL